jgi:hypothetical protein
VTRPNRLFGHTRAGSGGGCQLGVPAGKTLTIAAGSIIKSLDSGASITVAIDGTLRANGTTANPMTLSSLRDNSFAAGGDGWGLDNTAPAPGDWAGINVSGSQARLRATSLVFRYAEKAVTQQGGDVAIQDVELGQSDARVVSGFVQSSGTAALLGKVAVTEKAMRSCSWQSTGDCGRGCRVRRLGPGRSDGACMRSRLHGPYLVNGTETPRTAATHRCANKAEEERGARRKVEAALAATRAELDAARAGLDAERRSRRRARAQTADPGAQPDGGCWSSPTGRCKRGAHGRDARRGAARERAARHRADPCLAGALPRVRRRHRARAGARASRGRAGVGAVRGLRVSGKVGDPIAALGAIEDERRAFPADEVLISTYPKGTSNWLETNIVKRLREELAIPVTHVVREYLEYEHEHAW